MGRPLAFTDSRWYRVVDFGATTAFFVGASFACAKSAVAGEWRVAAPWAVAILWAVLALGWRWLAAEWRKLSGLRGAHYDELYAATMRGLRDLRR